MVRLLFRAGVLATIALLVACSSAPAQAPAASAAAPAASAPTASASAVSSDPEIQRAYTEAVKVIPNLSVDLLTGAKREGALSLYKLAYNFQGGMYQEFTKLFPFVKVTDFEGSATAVLDRFTTEGRAGRTAADLGMQSGSDRVDTLDSQGLLLHYEVAAAPKFNIGGKAGVYYPIGSYQLCNGYNSDLVSEADASLLQSWDGILDPKWKGKAAMITYPNGTVGALSYFYAFSRGQDFFDRMMAQKPLTFVAVPSMVERLGAGGISAIFMGNEGNLGDLQAKGAPIRWKCPEPALAIPVTQFIAKDAPHPNAAKLWMEWSLSKAAQSTMMATTGLRSARADMTDERPVTKQPWFKAANVFFSYDEAALNKATPTITEAYKRQQPQEIK